MTRTVSPKEYLDVSQSDRVNWIVDSLVPRPAYILVMGSPKAGKSFLMFDVGSRIAEGKDVFGCKVGRPARVLYLQLDTKRPAWTERLAELEGSGYKLNTANFRFVHPDDLLLPMILTIPQHREWLSKVLAAEKPDVIIIDVLREIHQADENDSTAMKVVFDSFESLFAGYTVFFVHHTRKMSRDDSADVELSSLARGSSYITGRVDAFWLLHGGYLKMISRFHEDQRLRAVQGDNGIFDYPDLDEDMKLLPKLLDMCAQNVATSHNQLWKKAHVDLKISRATYFRVLGGQSCAHRLAAAALPGEAPEPVDHEAPQQTPCVQSQCIESPDQSLP